MDALINIAINSVWAQASEPRAHVTPDDSLGKTFVVTSSTMDTITITTEGGTPIRIPRQSFVAAIRYLVLNRHDAANPCEIRSNKQIELAGPLCMAAREATGGTMVINYIAPILESTGIVALSGARPNRIWLA